MFLPQADPTGALDVADRIREAVRKLASKAGIPLMEEVNDPHADANRKLRGRLKDMHRKARRQS